MSSGSQLGILFIAHLAEHELGERQPRLLAATQHLNLQPRHSNCWRQIAFVTQAVRLGNEVPHKLSLRRHEENSDGTGSLSCQIRDGFEPCGGGRTGGGRAFLCMALPENIMRPSSALMSFISASGAARSRVSSTVTPGSSASAWDTSGSNVRVECQDCTCGGLPSSMILISALHVGV